MDDRDFFDVLFQQFAKTTGAENTFWTVQADEGAPGWWHVCSTGQDQIQEPIGGFWSEVDADFVAGVHGCLPDLVRRLHDALDEADRLDTERDEAEQNVFRLAVENEELREESQNLQGSWELMRLEISDLRAEAAQLRRERESWVSKAGDALWKIERPM